MNVLPWLLDWPPRPAAVGAFLLLTAFSVGTLLVFAPVTDQITTDNVTVEVTDFTVRLNDDLRIPETNGSVRTCVGSGTPGDRLSVVGDVRVDSPAAREDPLAVVVSLEHTSAETAQRLERGGATADVRWLAEDDETLSVGDKATVQVRVTDGDATLASAARSVPVENGSRSYDC
jgi:hypothetical protein